MVKSCLNVLVNEEVKQLMQSKTSYDLMIIEPTHTDGLFGMAGHFNATLIGLATSGGDWNLNDLVGFTGSSTFEPLMPIGFRSGITMVDRLYNWVLITEEWMIHKLIFLPGLLVVHQHFFGHLSQTFTEIRHNFSLILLNQHFSIFDARPNVPSLIEVGGMHVPKLKPQLPPELAQFIDDAPHGVILMCLGTELRSKDLPATTLAIILDTFATLPQRIIWKFEGSQRPNVSDNIYMDEWLPQQAILAHPNVRLFISHSGMLSIIEATFHAKPVLGMPLFFDQLRNAERMQLEGAGLLLNILTLTRQDFESAIRQLLDQPQYSRNVQALSQRFRDQPMHPLDTAVYWTEYILRYKGAPHMRISPSNIKFIDYYGLDNLLLIIVRLIEAETSNNSVVDGEMKPRRCRWLLGALLCQLLLVDIGFEVQGAKILAVFPFPGKSQYIFAEQYLKELARRDHNVTVINTFGSSEFEANFRVIGATKIHELIAAFGSADYFQPASQWTMLTMTTDFLNMLTANILEDVAVKELLQSQETFDLVLLETVQTDALFGLAQHFNALTIGISSYGTDRHIDELMGNISPLSFNPMLLSSRTEHMSYEQRLWNVWEASVAWLHKRLVHLPSQEKLYKQYFPKASKTMDQMLDSFSLMLLGQHFSLSYPRPYLPNMIEVGGLHLKQRDPKPLPANIAKFVEDAEHGVIYFSMGSNIKSSELPATTRKAILEAFGSLKQRVLWKFEQDQLEDQPENVLISKWFPQPDILAHPNVKLFITHGGLLSTIESIYFGKPVLGLPVFYDQHLNVERAKQAGYGLDLDLRSLSATALQDKILELLSNESYTQAVRLKSKLYKDQKDTPLERAIWWTEYVLRHKGAPHLRSASRDLNFLQLNGLDTWGFLCGVASLVAMIVLFALTGARILSIFPYPGPSQYINVLPYLKALASRGHEITSVNAFPQKKPVKNFRDIPVLEVFESYELLISQAMEAKSTWQENNFMNEFFMFVTRAVLNNSEVQRQLLPPGKDHYDLIIVEALRTDALYGFAAHFNAPIIGISTFGTDWNIDELVGNTSPLSYTPLVTAGLTDRMTYRERVINFYETAVASINWKLMFVPQQVKLYEQFFPHIAHKVPLVELSKNFSLIMLNQHFSLSFPRPYVPNMIEVGGLHISHTPAPLPKDIEEFIEGAGSAGVIYFSLGSNVKSKDLPEERKQMLLKTFASLPQRVLWKFEDDQLPGKPANVFLSKWFPQSDILAHPKVKLFITHGGLLSTIESIHHGKPVLGLPFFYDQFLNVERAKRAGFGLGLDHKEMTSSELKSTIERLLTEPEFSATAQKMSARYRDQPMSPQETAIWWTEYVLRHNGAHHMRVSAQDLSFIAYHSLDVIGMFLGIGFFVLFIISLVLWKLVQVCTKSKRSSSKNKFKNQ
ncbi:hypothetical protein ACLKA6_003437 [Drosophila palustris]